MVWLKIRLEIGLVMCQNVGLWKNSLFIVFSEQLGNNVLTGRSVEEQCWSMIELKMCFQVGPWKNSL